MTRTLGSQLVGAMLLGAAVVAAPAASAQPEPDFASVSLDHNGSGTLTGARVVASMQQWEYADISFNVAFEGFTANRTFPFREGTCPSWLGDVDAPATVFKCGWRQDGDTAILRMALRGTFDRSRIVVTLAGKALVTPAEPGTYAVRLTGWSFDDVTRDVRIVPGSCVTAVRGMSPRGDVICP